MYMLRPLKNEILMDFKFGNDMNEWKCQNVGINYVL